MVYVVFVLPGGAVFAFLAAFALLTWWLDVGPRKRRKILHVLGASATVLVAVAVLAFTAEKLGWIDAPSPYDAPEPLSLPARSAPPPEATPPPTLAPKADRATLEDARQEHARELQRFEQGSAPAP